MHPMKLLVALAAGIGALAAFNIGAMKLTTGVLLDMPAMAAAGAYADIGRDALAKYPNLSPLAARAKYSNDLLTKELADAPDDDARALVAAKAFIGFWMVQGRARAEFCEKAGVDFSAFRTSFSARNEGLHSLALPLLEGAELSEKRLWDMHDDIMRDQIGYEMLYIKNGQGLPTEKKEACEFLLEKRHELMPFLEFRSAAPAGYKALVNTLPEG